LRSVSSSPVVLTEGPLPGTGRWDGASPQVEELHKAEQKNGHQESKEGRVLGKMVSREDFTLHQPRTHAYMVAVPANGCDVWLLAMLPGALLGALGGVSSFIHALNRGTIREGKYFKKFAIEVGGGMIVAPCTAILLINVHVAVFMFCAFVIGLSWARVIELLRDRVTEIVLVTIREAVRERPSRSSN
jgi:hypothetical protein